MHQFHKKGGERKEWQQKKTLKTFLYAIILLMSLVTVMVKIKGFLKDHGCWFLKYWGGAAYTKSGIPDILACCNGKFLGIEVKAKNGKPSELQLYNLKKIDEAGGFAILLYPDDFETFKTMIELIQSGCTCGQYYKKLKGRWSN